MIPLVQVGALTENEWKRYRDLRLAALESDGQAFGGNLESERLFTETMWREKAAQYIGIVATVSGKDIGIMTVENLDGDFGSTCWVGSCWVNPEFRKLGVLRSLFQFVDEHALVRDWSVQGLGVWVDSFSAIAAYEKLGFVMMGEKQESARKPSLYYQRMVRNAAK
jgi:GNAT superfamily N-acetyltransferase